MVTPPSLAGPRRVNVSRSWSLPALIGLGVLLALPPLSATAQSPPTTGSNVLICEATGNPAAPYVEVAVAQSDLGSYGSATGDIVPAPAGGCPGRASAKTTPPPPHHRRHHRPRAAPQPAIGPSPRQSTAPTPSPTGSTAPALRPTPSPPAAETPRSVAPAPPPAAPARELPQTGANVKLTMVLGLLLLYLGVVMRWATAPRRAEAHRP